LALCLILGCVCCAQVPSIFAARHLIGHKHVLVNGRPTNRSGLLLQPMAIVEPRPQSKAIFRRLIRRRLANNTFVFADRDTDREQKDADERASRDAEPAQSIIDLERLRQVRMPARRSHIRALTVAPRASPRIQQREGAARWNGALVFVVLGADTRVVPAGEVSNRRRGIR
jgi:ribosomal protein S4